MIENNRNNEQIYGRNDMIMLDQNNKIYGSLGLADRYVMKTEEGTRLMLSNPKLGRFDDVLTEFNIYGMSKQECTTGAQLYDMDTRLNVDGIEYKKNGTSYTVNIVKASGNLLYGVPFQFSKEDVDATLSVSQFSNLEQPNVRINLLDLEDNVVGTLWAKNAEKEISAKCSKIRFNWSKGGKFIVSDLMLNFGNTALPYEPYTGGKPSPSPDYPQEIVSVGENGSIEVNVRGKNLVDVYGYSANDIPSPKAERVLFNIYGTTLSTTEKTDKLIVHQEIIDGATTNSYVSGYFCIGINRKLEANKDYIITFRINVIRNPLSASNVKVSFNGIEFENGKIIGDKVTVKAKYTEYRERQYVEVRNSGMSLEISDFMITEVGETDDYEPYYEEQTVTLPHTLNAIPVASGGNVTINGQQYIADYVNVERGKLVKMVDSSKLDNTQSIVNKTEWLLAEPQEIDLTQEEMEQYKKLRTKTPTTIVENNYNTWMKATYKSTESV